MTSHAVKKTDVVIIGAGHNGLVAAILLAKAGLRVRVLEERSVIGGAARTEAPFSKAPGLRTSTGAYLLGVMPPEVLAATGVKIGLKRRDPHYFLPTTGDRYLMLGTDSTAAHAQFTQFFSEADWRANEALNAEVAAIRDDIAPAFLAEPLSIEHTAARHVRPALRDAFVKLCRGSVGDYLDRFGFKSDLVKAMYAVTDGFAGVFGTWDTPGTGMNFLSHNMNRLPDSGGTWAIVEGGMGALSAALAAEATRRGVVIETNARVERVIVERGSAVGVIAATEGKNGSEVRANVVLSNADPFRTRELVGRAHLPWSFLRALDDKQRDGTTFKLNLALKGLPRFRCLPDGDRAAFGPTIHLLPDEDVVLESLFRSFSDVRAGRLPEFPAIEWYLHTTIDPSLKDAHGHHNSAFFVQWVPYTLAGGKSWDQEAEPYAKHLLKVADRFAPGTSDLVVDMMPLPPPAIERHFGITRGHIQHVDNTLGFSDRVPYAWPLAGMYSCSAGTHPAGGVSGCAGYNAAHRVARDLGKRIPAA